MRSVVPMKTAKIGYLVISVLFCVLGIVLIAAPGTSVVWLGRLLGIGMIVFGAIKLVGYFSRDLFRLAFQYDLGFGLSMIVLGAIIMVLNVRIQEHIQPIVGLLILLDGMLKIQTSKDARKFGLETWYQLLILAVLAGALGAAMVVMAFVEKSSHVVNGFALLAEGIMNHMLVNKTVLPEHSRTVSDHG